MLRFRYLVKTLLQKKLQTTPIKVICKHQIYDVCGRPTAIFYSTLKRCINLRIRDTVLLERSVIEYGEYHKNNTHWPTRHSPTKEYATVYNKHPMNNRKTVKLHILPVLGNKSIDEITRDNIRKLHLDVNEKRAGESANRILALVNSIFNFGIKNN